MPTPLDLLDRFNCWYDRLPPAPRFFSFIGVMALATFPLQLGVHFGHKPSIVFGLLLFSLMALVAAGRAMSRKGVHTLMGVFILLCTGLLCLGLLAH